MHLNLPKGRHAEAMAVRFLTEAGYHILEQNYRYSHSEIDIICKTADLLVFVEVKYRSTLFFGYPEEAVNERKIESINKASENYIYESGWTKDIRFDVISIMKNGNASSIYHIKDAF